VRSARGETERVFRNSVFAELVALDRPIDRTRVAAHVASLLDGHRRRRPDDHAVVRLPRPLLIDTPPVRGAVPW
jgi:hypothetical protein